MAYIPNPNQSVSGTVGASLIGQIAPHSVLVLNPTSTVGISGIVPVAPNNSSVISISQGSVATVIIGGSIAASFTPPANQSVSGTVGASVIGHAPVVIVGGSILTSSTPNQSISGTVQTDVRGSVAVAIISGSIAATFTPPANQSVSGTVGASIIGEVPVNIPNGVLPTDSGSWGLRPEDSTHTSGSLGNFVLAVRNDGGSVLTNADGDYSPFAVDSRGAIFIKPLDVIDVSGSVTSRLDSTNASVITVAKSSVAVAIVSGSVAVSVTPPANQSVSGTVQTDVNGSVAVAIISGSVAVATGNSSVQVLNFPSNQSVSGTVGTTQQGTWISSIVNTVPSSVIVGASIFGLPPVNVTNTNLNVGGSVVAFQGTTEWTVKSSITGGIFPISGSVAATITNTNVNVSGSVVAFGFPTTQNVSGSVAAFVVGSSSIITRFADSSLLSVPVGSTIALIQANSIVGTYAEDAGHTTADKGVFVMGVRNDAVSSITSAERDYSPHAVDDVGRTIIVPFAGQQACIISYIGSTVSGSVQLIQASVIGSRSYVTDFSLNNTGSTTTLVTVQGGDTSILGQFVVPAGGGNNKVWNMPLRTTTSQDLAFKVSPSQSILYVTFKGYQAP